MGAFAPLTPRERLLLTAATAQARQALWHELSAARGLAEARLRGRELEHLRALEGFASMDEAAQALLSGAFVHEQSAGLARWQVHHHAAVDAHRRAQAHLEALGLPAPAVAGGAATAGAEVPG